MNKAKILSHDRQIAPISKNIINRVVWALKNLFIIILFLLFMCPFFLILINSFKSTADFIANPTALPQKLNLSNYITAFRRMNFITAFFNSIIITVMSCSLIIVLSAMTAYILNP
ncbi:MAG: hypothetical protein ACUVRM_01205 [Bacillota bacterium]